MSVIKRAGQNEYATLANNVGAGTKVGSGKTGLYRIIGSIYDELEGTNRLKVIKATPIYDGNLFGYVWDYKSDGTFANIWATPTETRNNITNNYSNSTTSGSTLMQLLNNGAWWNGTTGVEYQWNSNDNSTPNSININYTGKGLSSSAKGLVDISRYYLADASPRIEDNPNGFTMYKMERTGVRSDNTPARYDENRPLYWEGNVGLMYPSDYAFAAGNTCQEEAFNYRNNECYKKDWLTPKEKEWLQSTNYISPYGVWFVSSGGFFNYREVDINGFVRPVFSLKSDVIFTSGDGTLNNPYIITR